MSATHLSDLYLVRITTNPGTPEASTYFVSKNEDYVVPGLYTLKGARSVAGLNRSRNWGPPKTVEIVPVSLHAGAPL